MTVKKVNKVVIRERKKERYTNDTIYFIDTLHWLLTQLLFLPSTVIEINGQFVFKMALRKEKGNIHKVWHNLLHQYIYHTCS